MTNAKKPAAKKTTPKKAAAEPCKFCAALDDQSHTRHCPNYVKPVRKD